MIGSTNCGKVNSKYKQLVNYVMLYDGSLGDSGENGANVCSDITGGFSKMVSIGSADLTYNSDNMVIKNTDLLNNNSALMVNNSIDLTDYKLLCGLATPISDKQGSNNCHITTAIHVRNNKGYGNAGVPNTSSVDKATDNTTVSNTINTEFLGTKFMYDCDVNNLDGGYPCFANYCMTQEYSSVKVYSMYLVKGDNWQELCTIAGLDQSNFADENALCSDNIAITTILNNEKAVNFMIYNCTGTFMYYFIRNSNCLTALNNSQYKTMIQANEHWAKFLSMVA